MTSRDVTSDVKVMSPPPGHHCDNPTLGTQKSTCEDLSLNAFYGRTKNARETRFSALERQLNLGRRSKSRSVFLLGPYFAQKTALKLSKWFFTVFVGISSMILIFWHLLEFFLAYFGNFDNFWLFRKFPTVLIITNSYGQPGGTMALDFWGRDSGGGVITVMSRGWDITLTSEVTSRDVTVPEVLIYFVHWCCQKFKSIISFWGFNI